MRAELQTLLNRLVRLQAKLKPRPRLERKLPKVFVDPETGEALPGYEEANAEASRLSHVSGIEVKEYCFDPTEEGIEV